MQNRCSKHFLFSIQTLTFFNGAEMHILRCMCFVINYLKIASFTIFFGAFKNKYLNHSQNQGLDYTIYQPCQSIIDLTPRLFLQEKRHLASGQSRIQELHARHKATFRLLDWFTQFRYF